ncbi:UNVERIFIED_CONTAM: hypothetical protein Scaly_2707500 [Sesamum calycinum]|uniref:Uncharacterized protein n=1 Tax=Sesamum calycinum TaxID=2727403 RepID=A0AAW2J4A8_9LAMI
MFFWYYLFFLIGELFTVFFFPAVSLLLITLQVGDNVEEAVDFDVESLRGELREIGADDDVGIQAILSRLEKQRSSDFSINSGHNRSEASEHYSCGYLSRVHLCGLKGSNWQPLSLVPGLLTDAPPQNAPGSVPVTSNEEDEFEKWQREVRPATPPEGEKEFTDDDGTTYKWDWTLGAWVPQMRWRRELGSN